MTPSRLLLKFVLTLSKFHFQIFDAIHFKNFGQRFNDLLGELDNFYRLNYCIFAFAVGNTEMTE